LRLPYSFGKQLDLHDSLISLGWNNLTLLDELLRSHAKQGYETENKIPTKVNLNDTPHLPYWVHPPCECPRQLCYVTIQLNADRRAGYLNNVSYSKILQWIEATHLTDLHSEGTM